MVIRQPDALSTIMGFPHSIVCDQRAHFTANEVWQCIHAHGVHSYYRISHNPEVASLIE